MLYVLFCVRLTLVWKFGFLFHGNGKLAGFPFTALSGSLSLSVCVKLAVVIVEFLLNN